MGEKATVLLYGLGNKLNENLDFLEKMYNIAAIVDGDCRKHGLWKGYDVIPPLKIKDYCYEKIIITPIEYFSILVMLQAMGIPNERIELLYGRDECEHMW